MGPDQLPEPDQALRRAVRALPDRQAEVVALHHVGDQSVADIAAILDCAEGTVKSHLHEARRADHAVWGRLTFCDAASASSSTTARPGRYRSRSSR